MARTVPSGPLDRIDTARLRAERLRPEHLGGVEPIGRAVLRHAAIDGLDEVETGYAFYAPFRRRGYATEVTEACTSLGFDRLGLTSVVALTHEGNAPSHGVLARCGFGRERALVLDGLPLVLFRRVKR
jgi:RimJ/RimL family protein N-acetyltransferase